MGVAPNIFGHATCALFISPPPVLKLVYTPGYRQGMVLQIGYGGMVLQAGYGATDRVWWYGATDRVMCYRQGMVLQAGYGATDGYGATGRGMVLQTGVWCYRQGMVL